MILVVVGLNFISYFIIRSCDNVKVVELVDVLVLGVSVFMDVGV